MSKLITRIKQLALALCLATPIVSWADAITAVNPVTGETETYTYKFIGTDTWAGTEYWQDSDGNNPSAVPAKSSDNIWEPILFDGNAINVDTDMSVEGWNLRMGLYNGATVTMNNFVKYQGDTTMWMTVDKNSQLTIGGFGEGNITDNQVIKLSVAKANGITWNVGLTSDNANNTFEYYLAGEGSVSYQGVTAANHKIKQADATISGTSQVASKTLVTFTSTDKTFTADAAVVLKDNNGDELKTVYATSVTTADDTTLTGEEDVGTCELVQTTTGIVLYWVDGDPAALAPATVYKPSININFTNDAGNGLTTSADVGLEGYAVPGTSWNNFTIPDNANVQTFNSVNSIDSTGAASVASGVSVTVSGHRGRYSCGSLDAASNPLHGYIDEGAQKATPTVTITGIPYEHYRVIVYHSTDTANVPFGYDTINGFDFTYVDRVQTTGTDSWGSSGADQSAEPIAEGVNTLVSAVLSGDTVTMVAHRIGGQYPSARGCFAAIQVVEYVPEVGENDLEIAVDGAKEYEVTEAKDLSGTVYLTGSGTLTLTGSEKITAVTIDVAKDVVLNINADRLDATTFTGAGTVVYDTTAPVEGKGWANIGWSGTVWIKNQAVSSFEGTKFGNAGSTVRFTGVTGFLQTSSWQGSTYVHTVPLELVDEGNTIAFTYNNGWGGNLVKINTLKGTGTLQTQGSGAGEHIYIVDASGFTGVFNLTAKSVYVGGDAPAYSDTTGQSGKLEIRSGVTMTVPSSKAWTANGGFVVDGTLNATGTLASTHASKAISGSGTVVFGGVPSPTGDAWWKNSAWTGTVQVNGYTSMAGNIPFNSCGNAGSIVELKNVTGWINTSFTCTPKLKVTGTLYLNNGSSGKNNAFKVGTLLGDGTISGDGSAGTVVFNVTTDWSGFTGTIGLNNKCVVFGETIPDTITAGQIYISEGAVVTPQQSSGIWWAVGGIKVDGELRAPNLDKFGGGTTITTTDTGVFTLTDSNNTDDKGVDYARITGTGTLRYADVSGKWRALSAVNFPTGMICENNLSAGLILTTQGENIIGSLAGSGQMRSDWGGSGNVGDRTLRILQAKDTTYSGLFSSSNERVSGVYVAPGATTAGTLTLSGTQTASNELTVESGAAVNLTGTWVGATTVAGTIGGTGTLDGNLTFSDGATFKANASALTVSGTVTIPAGEGESLTIVATDLDADEVTILSSESITTETDVSKVTVDGLYTVEPVAGALKLVSTKVAVTIPAIANATVTVSVGGKTIGTEAGTYNVAPDAVVTATYAAAQGYEISGQTVYTIDVANSETTFDPAGTTEVKQYVAYVVFQVEQGESFVDVTNYYTTVAVAIDAAKALKRTIVLIAQPDAEDTYEIAVGETINVKKGEFTFDGIIFPTGPQYNNTTTEIAGVTQYKCTTFTVTVQYPGQEPVGMTGQLIQILGGLYSGYVPGYAGTVVTVLDGSDATVGDAMPDVFTYNSEAHTYTLKTMVASYNNGYTTTYYPTLASAITNVPVNGTITLVAACPDALVLEKAVTIDVGETVSFGAGIDITVDGGYVITDETTEINKSYNTTWVVDVLDSETTPRRVKYGYGATRTVKMDYLSGDGNVVVTIGDLVRQVPEAVAAEMGGPSGAYFYVKDGADLSFTVTPYGDRLVSSATIKVGEADPVDLPAPVGDVYTATVTGDSVINVTFAMAQAKIGTTLYPTLQDALNVGGEVTLLANQTLTASLVVAAEKTVVLDLNGKTVNGVDPVLRNNGTLTINDTVGGGKLKGGSAIQVKTGSTTVIKGGTFEGGDGCIWSGSSNNYSVTIDGGTFSSTDNAILMGNGNPGNGVNSTWTINGGTFTGGIQEPGYIACGIYAPDAAAWTINGGTFNITGGCGIAVRAGVVSITGGTINATGTVTGWVGDKKRNLPCAAVIYDVNPGAYPGYDSATSKVAITGGTFNSAVAAVQMLGEGLITSTDNTLTVADDYKWATTETVGVYKLAVKSGIDPTDPTSTQEVVIEPTGDADADKAAAIAQAEVTVPEGDVASTGVDADTYKTYFNYTATDKGNGVYEVTVDPVKDLNEEVVLPEEVQVGTETITQTEELLEAATDAQVEEATVPAVPGIYYSMVAANNLAFEEAVEGDQTLATGQTVTIAKPEQLPTGNAVFFRVKASATPNN